MQKKKQLPSKPVPTMQDLIHTWEVGVHNQLIANKNALHDCSPAEKAFYKDKVNTLCDVLSHLQGRRAVRTEDRALRDQNTQLKMVLQKLTCGSNKMAANYRVQRKLNKDLNTQLSQQLQSTNKERQENKKLRHQMKTMKISCSRSLDEPASDSDVVEEKVEEEEWAWFSSVEKPTFDMMTTRLINQTETIAKLKVNLREAEGKLDAQRQEARGALLTREQEWAERVETLERQLQSLEASSTSRPKSLKRLFWSQV